VTARAVPSNKLTLLQLLARVNDPDSTLDDIVDVLACDVAMSVKVLRFVNSAAAGLTTKVDSIQHASVLLGRDTLRSWTSLTMMSALDDKPAELVTLALSRAKFCELVAVHLGAPNPATYYAVGMLSLLDVMFDTTMHDIVDKLPVNDTIRAALLGVDNQVSDVLRQAIELERTDSTSGRPDPHIARAHYDAVVWTTELLTSAVAA
jgi:EAL and modified HD-GYP domain-containing signal transduction protein